MSNNDPLARTKELTAQVFKACTDAGMKVEHDQERHLIIGKDFHIKVKDVPIAKHE